MSRKRPSLDDLCVLVKTSIEVGSLHEQNEVDEEFNEVFCTYADLYSSEFYAAANTDFKINMILIIDGESYDGEKKLIYQDTRYTIVRAYQRDDGLIEVTCSEN